MLLTLLWCYYCQLWIYFTCFSRSTCPEVLCKKGVLRNFAKFTGNTCARVRKRFWHRCFLWILRNFKEHLFLQNTSGGCFVLFLRTPILKNICKRLLCIFGNCFIKVSLHGYISTIIRFIVIYKHNNTTLIVRLFCWEFRNFFLKASSKKEQVKTS